MLAQINIPVQVLPEALIGRQHLWLCNNYASSISPKWTVFCNESLSKLGGEYLTELKDDPWLKSGRTFEQKRDIVKPDVFIMKIELL